MDNNERIEHIKQKLNEALNPTHLNVIDNSYQHVGHAGAQSGAGHFTVEIASEQFQDCSKVKCHQMIYAAVGDMIPTEIHALQIVIK